MIKKIGADRIFPNLEKALNAIYIETHKTDSEMVGCPLKTVIYSEEPESPNTIVRKLQPWKLLHN